MDTPYGLVADVKMLNFFRDMGPTAAIVIALLVLGSMLVQNFWCRYLCPYGALMGSGFAAESGQDSPRCRGLHRLREVRARLPGRSAGRPPGADPVRGVQRMHGLRRGLPAAKCTAVCVAAEAHCAAHAALVPARSRAAGRRRAFSRISSSAVILLARVTSHWQTNIPRTVYMNLVPQANELTHPGM